MGTTVKGLTTQVLASTTGRLKRQYSAASTPTTVCTGNGMKAIATPAPKAVVIACRFMDHSCGSMWRCPKTRRYQRPRRASSHWPSCLTILRGMHLAL
jgi:hypothetical protein